MRVALGRRSTAGAAADGGIVSRRRRLGHTRLRLPCNLFFICIAQCGGDTSLPTGAEVRADNAHPATVALLHSFTPRYSHRNAPHCSKITINMSGRALQGLQSQSRYCTKARLAASLALTRIAAAHSHAHTRTHSNPACPTKSSKKPVG
jgi:hypothetical protein